MSAEDKSRRRISVLPLLLLLISPIHQNDVSMVDGSSSVFGTTQSAYRSQLNAHHPKRQQQQQVTILPSSFGIRSFLNVRGGDSSGSVNDVDNVEEEVSLEDKVAAAMAKLGLSPDGLENDGQNENDGEAKEAETDNNPPEETQEEEEEEETEPTNEHEHENIQTTIQRISKDMNVDERIVVAALGATREENGVEDGRLNEKAAREMIQMELDAIASVEEDCEEVQTLISEGHQPFLARRALAFSGIPSDDGSTITFSLPTARAILLADEEDAQEEADEILAAEAEAEAIAKATQRKKEAEQKKEAESRMKTVQVDGGFDPTKLPVPSSASTPSVAAPAAAAPSPTPAAPPPAKESDVIFEATSENIASVVLESPVPVLLDVYADWCGPCKSLTPALAEMAVRGGGLFRLVKLDTDAERTLSSALEVSSLPTVFAIRDGRIVNSFTGMPRDQSMIQTFMMGLMTGEATLTDEEKEKYENLSRTFMKVAGSAGFSFEDREKLVDRVTARLDGMNASDAARAAKVLRSLLANVIKNPYEQKFRRINLENKVLAKSIRPFPPAMAILRSVGFGREEGMPRGILLLGGSSGKRVVNVTPLTVASDAIDKWAKRNKREIAIAERARRDEVERERLLAEAEEVDEEEEEEEEEVEEVDPDACKLKARIEGKNKIHDLEMRAEDTLTSVLTKVVPGFGSGTDDEEEVQEYRITCTARRLVISSLDEVSMGRSLREHRLLPSASIVIKAAAPTKQQLDEEESSFKERAAARIEKTKKRPRENTMQSVGIYSKDDNAKGELIDGGGGTWYEQDVSSDDEATGEEEVEEEKEEESSSEGEEEQEEDEEGI